MVKFYNKLRKLYSFLKVRLKLYDITSYFKKNIRNCAFRLKIMVFVSCKTMNEDITLLQRIEAFNCP